ncbi:metallophosphoesterase [Candidatus Woesearchaeota archaeon]|nr:metallophosphoesterase [Candidatus Woesearchaeota archaeon]
MSIALISDIHGNLPALDAVLYDILFNKKISKLSNPGENIRCLGDIVGYYPWPNECVDRIEKYKIPCVKGNHDRSCSDNKHEDDPELYFEKWGELSKHTGYFTRELLTFENKTFLRHLDYKVDEGSFSWVHANPIEPRKFKYVLAKPSTHSLLPFVVMSKMKESPVFIAHLHIPSIFEEQDGNVLEYTSKIDYDNQLPLPKGPFQLKPDTKYLINIGSVGQPRDRNPESCYAEYDEDANTVQFHRVKYDIPSVQITTIGAGYGFIKRGKNEKPLDVGKELSARLADGR